MGKVSNYIIELAHMVQELLNNNIKPEYVELEMREKLNDDEYSFFLDNKDIIYITLNQ